MKTVNGAYGYQLNKAQVGRRRFDQVDRVIFDLKNNPYSRRIITNIYNHADLHAMNLYPCAYSMTFSVTGNRLNEFLIKDHKMFVAITERSVFNIIAYACSGNRF